MSEASVGPQDPRDYRCSDAEREAVAEVVRQALEQGRLGVEETSARLDQVYEAKTYRDLEGAVSDLPPSAVPPALRIPPHAAADPGSALAVRPGANLEPPSPEHPLARVRTDAVVPDSSTSALAVLSEVKRNGVWTLPAESSAVAVLGSVVIDLRDAWLQTAEPRLQAYALLGEVQVIVPDDVYVVSDGANILGQFDARQEQVQGHQVLRLTGAAIMGEVSVKRKRRKSH